MNTRDFKVGDKVRASGGFSFDPSIGVVVDRTSIYVIVNIIAGKNDMFKERHSWHYEPSELKIIHKNKEE